MVRLTLLSKFFFLVLRVSRLRSLSVSARLSSEGTFLTRGANPEESSVAPDPEEVCSVCTDPFTSLETPATTVCVCTTKTHEHCQREWLLRKWKPYYVDTRESSLEKLGQLEGIMYCCVVSWVCKYFLIDLRPDLAGTVFQDPAVISQALAIKL